MRSVTDRTAFADGADLLADSVGSLGEAEGEDDRHHHGDGERAGEIAGEDQAPVAEYAGPGDAWALVPHCQRAEREDAGEQIETEQVEHAEADREEDGAKQRLAGLYGNGDGESRGERQDGAGHVGADQRIAGGHEDFRFTGVDHLGDEFCWRDIGHEFFPRYLLMFSVLFLADQTAR